METLRDFVAAEIKRLGVSILQFAQMVGVSHTTINNLLSDEPFNPTVELLFKLSRATDTDIIALLKLAYPEMVRNGLSAKARILAEKIEQASPEVQHMVMRLLD